eukprot:TRINITY_DN37002_c0_g1_i1.p1 TRINITY_DN37002_c0_g1~~TRINITY_DN37002_c0_g1_i1.p1  ORF type:complete len:593 (+),score=57.53 TRINITY_DN37002_c0_g1_i1:83-1861(+)
MTWPQDRFAYLFFVVYLCLLVHVESLNDFDKAALLERVEYHIRWKNQKTFCSLDSDRDGILTVEEAAQEIARRIGADPEEFQMFLDEQYGSWGSCWEGLYKQPQFFQIWTSGFFMAAGRIDLTPCIMSRWSERIVWTSMGDYKEDWLYMESVSEGAFKNGMIGIARAIPIAEGVKFRRQMDTDGDGCLSKAEYDEYWKKCSSWAWANFTTITEFAAIEEYIQLYRSTSVDNSSCVDEVAWQMWSLEPIVDSILALDGSHANQSCKTQTPNQAEIDQGSMNLTLVIVLGCCGLVAIISVSCLAYRYRNRQYRVNLDQAKQVQKLLKAKIDAWSIFDVSLCTKACDLEPAFMHSLGLQGYQPEMLDLVSIAHPDDASVLQDMLGQLERDLDSGSLPQMTKLRFVYGATGEDVVQSYCDKPLAYIPVELLMAWGSETRSTALVGITMLGEAPSVRSLPSIGTVDAPNADALYEPRHASLSETAGSVRSQGEFILNGSEVLSCGESEAVTFKSMTAKDHQGGQITKFFSDIKTSELIYAFRPGESGNKAARETAKHGTGSASSSADTSRTDESTEHGSGSASSSADKSRTDKIISL